MDADDDDFPSNDGDGDDDEEEEEDEDDGDDTSDKPTYLSINRHIQNKVIMFSANFFRYFVS
jgi:hypothetical protein